jgi:hypothetical protein
MKPRMNILSRTLAACEQVAKRDREKEADVSAYSVIALLRCYWGARGCYLFKNARKKI